MLVKGDDVPKERAVPLFLVLSKTDYIRLKSGLIFLPFKNP